MKLVGITGKKQSGKDTFANFMIKLLPEQKVVKLSLAHPLKYFVTALLEIDSKHVWGSDNDKNYPIAAWGKIFKDELLLKYKKDQYDLLTGREALQVIGTDVMRKGGCYLRREYWERTKKFLAKNNVKINNEIWIQLLLRDFKKSDADVVIVPDVLFFNELDMIKDQGGILVRIYRDTGKSDSIMHPSELEMESMKDEPFDFIVDDDGNRTMKELKQRVMNFIYQFEFSGV